MDPKRPPESKVVHVRGLTPKITENNLIDLVSRYGRVTCVIMLPHNNQALIEFDNVDGARNLVLSTSPPSKPLNLFGVPCYFNFSTSKYIQRSKKETSHINPKILLFTILNPKYPITVDVIKKICSPHGKVLKTVIFQKTELHALVQLADDMTAYNMKTNLDGCDIYADCCTLKIEYARTDDLNVTKNDSLTWDISKEFSTNTTLLDHNSGTTSQQTPVAYNPYSEPIDEEIFAHPYYFRYFEQYLSSTGSESAARAAARAAAVAAIKLEREEEVKKSKAAILQQMTPSPSPYSYQPSLPPTYHPAPMYPTPQASPIPPPFHSLPPTPIRQNFGSNSILGNPPPALVSLHPPRSRNDSHFNYNSGKSMTYNDQMNQRSIHERLGHRSQSNSIMVSDRNKTILNNPRTTTVSRNVPSPAHNRQIHDNDAIRIKKSNQPMTIIQAHPSNAPLPLLDIDPNVVILQPPQSSNTHDSPSPHLQSYNGPMSYMRVPQRAPHFMVQPSSAMYNSKKFRGHGGSDSGINVHLEHKRNKSEASLNNTNSNMVDTEGNLFVLYGVKRNQMNCRMIFNLFSAFGTVLKVRYSGKKSDKVYVETLDSVTIAKLLSACLIGNSHNPSISPVICEIPSNNLYNYNSKMNAFNQSFPLIAFHKHLDGTLVDFNKEQFSIKIAPIYDPQLKIEDIEMRGMPSGSDAIESMVIDSNGNEENGDDLIKQNKNSDEITISEKSCPPTKVNSSYSSNHSHSDQFDPYLCQPLEDGTPIFVKDFTEFVVDSADIFDMKNLAKYSSFTNDDSLDHQTDARIPAKLFEFVYVQMPPISTPTMGDYGPTASLLLCNLPPKGVTVEMIRKIFESHDAPVPLGVILNTEEPKSSEVVAMDTNNDTIMNGNSIINSENNGVIKDIKPIKSKNIVCEKIEKERAALKDIADSYNVLACRGGELIRSPCSTVIVEYNSIADAIKAISLTNFLAIAYNDASCTDDQETNPPSPLYFVVKMFFWCDKKISGNSSLVGSFESSGMSNSMGGQHLRHQPATLHVSGGMSHPRPYYLPAPHHMLHMGPPPPSLFLSSPVSIGSRGIKRKQQH